MNAKNSFLVAIICAVTILLCAVSVLAEPRTTPVQVANLLGIDPNNNTVKAQQLGTWTVNVGGTAAATQSGTWNVGILGTPNVNVANTPIVQTPTQHNLVQLWSTDQTILNGGSLASSIVDCAGYKELRVFLAASNSSATVTAKVWWFVPGGGQASFGRADFSAATTSIVQGGNFQGVGSYCVFTMPAMSDRFRIEVFNSTGVNVTVYRQSCVYLVN